MVLDVQQQKQNCLSLEKLLLSSSAVRGQLVLTHKKKFQIKERHTKPWWSLASSERQKGSFMEAWWADAKHTCRHRMRSCESAAASMQHQKGLSSKNLSCSTWLSLPRIASGTFLFSGQGDPITGKDSQHNWGTPTAVYLSLSPGLWGTAISRQRECW